MRIVFDALLLNWSFCSLEVSSLMIEVSLRVCGKSHYEAGCLEISV